MRTANTIMRATQLDISHAFTCDGDAFVGLILNHCRSTTLHHYATAPAIVSSLLVRNNRCRVISSLDFLEALFRRSVKTSRGLTTVTSLSLPRAALESLIGLPTLLAGVQSSIYYSFILQAGIEMLSIAVQAEGISSLKVYI